MKDLWQDVRYAIRVLLRNRGFSAIVVGTLALGIGPNIAIFYFLHEVLARPPPRVAQPDRLVQLRRWGPARDSEGFSHEGYKEYRDHATLFSGLLAVRGVELNLSDSGRPERIDGELVTGNYFQVLGMRAAHGRVIGPEDDRAPGAHPVAVLSHMLWQQRFAGDPRLVGRTVALNGFRYTVLGIAPPEFRGLEVGAGVAGRLRRDVMRAVQRQGLTLAAAGLGLGIPISLAAARLVVPWLYGVGPADAVTLAAGAVLLAVIALGAAWIPARRALHIDAMAALRYE